MAKKSDKAAAITPYPCVMTLVNDTVQAQNIYGKHVDPHQSVSIEIRDEDFKTRVETDIAYRLEVSSFYKPVEGKPNAIRLIDADSAEADADKPEANEPETTEPVTPPDTPADGSGTAGGETPPAA